MTTEIAVINREAVALAADSAVTIGGGEKVYNSANKLFALSAVHPIGVMIYGSAALNFIPWETIIKMYRREHGADEYDSLSEYAKKFLNFIEDNHDLFWKINEEIAVNSAIRSTFSAIKYDIIEGISEKIRQQGSISASEERVIIKDKIKNILEFFDSLNNYFTDSHFKPTEFRSIYKDEIQEICDDIFQFISQKITKTSRGQLAKIASQCIQKDWFNPSSSGIVFAGFGRKDLTPDLITYDVDLLYKGKLKHQKNKSKSYGDRRPGPAILSFAQDDVIATFIDGISPSVEIELKGILQDTLKSYFEVVISQVKRSGNSANIDIDNLKLEYEKHQEMLVNSYVQRSERVKQMNFRGPLESVVGNLPRSELAEIADSLVSLTSLKRRVSIETESVGGPTDVAIISKGDGFVWVKRKHYFDPNLNTDFFERKRSKN